MHNNLNNQNKNYKIKFITYSLIGAILINGFFSNIKNKHTNVPRYVFEAIDEFTINDIKELIYSSPYLTTEEKDFLYNEDFLNDILPIINENMINQLKYQQHLSNLSINNYDANDNNYLGYYTSLSPNKLYVRNYDGSNRDTVAHEFIHLCQNTGDYNTITEACAEIISYEYFSETKIDAYATQVKLLRKLMEIIGSEPIWIYNFTGNFKPIEEAIKPYLTSKEYSTFLECLSFEHGDTLNNRSKFDTLDKLIGIIYQNKYQDDITNNEIMQILDNNSAVLTRYYFNPRMINEANSYYYDRSIKEYNRLDYETAMLRNIFYAYAIKYEPISSEEALDAINNGKFSVSREIDFKKNDINILHRIDRSYETHISAIIDGIKYDNVSIDYLASQGIITINYYRVYFQTLTAEEYLNQECMEGAKIYTIYSIQDITLYDDYIEGYMPKMGYLEPFKISGTTKKLTK